MSEPEYIVAEISKNWNNGVSPSELLICEQFEAVIARNLARGYLLHSFQLDRRAFGSASLNETIIAVFQRRSD